MLQLLSQFAAAYTMSRSTTIKLPPLETSSSPVTVAMKGRARSSSIVKVEEVGDSSVEEVLDRSAFVNMNADWVNSKGVYRLSDLPRLLHFIWSQGRG